VRTARQVALFHVVDTAVILLALCLTGGALSPFSTMFLFVLLAAGYRWGRQETWLTCGTGIVVLGLHGVAARFSGWLADADGHLVLLRLAYVGLGGVLIGYMAETERIHRHRTWAVSKILSRVRAEAGLVAAVHAVLEELAVRFRASHAVLVLEEEGNDRLSIWHAKRRAGEPGGVSIRLDHRVRDGNGTYCFTVPARVDAFKVRRAAPDEPIERARVVALDAGSARVNEAFPVAPLLAAPFQWTTAFCVSSLAGDGWTGRVFLFLPFDPPAVREQLRYFQTVVHQTGPALFNLYLQRRLQSRAGVVERMRISRELHDGVIQTLIGIEMQMEALRREAAGQVPESLAAQLANIQRLLGQEVLDVRDLMQLLKPEEVDAKRLTEHLAGMIERFSQHTGIQARMVCDADDIDLTPRACREVAAIVREALANVRKHSGATRVLVRLEQSGRNWKLVVDDNGCGLDFDGYLAPDEVDAQRKGPVIIKERARAIGGSLALRSQRGFGAQLEITIPPKHHA
jgi:signal transduction histidine kinase